MFIHYQIIGKRIREERRKKGISQEALAEMAELSTQYVSQIERADRQASLRSLVNIANALGKCRISAYKNFIMRLLYGIG